MNEYITLDSYKYPTLSDAWASNIVRPGSTDPMLNGDIAVTFGPSSYRMWMGTVKAEVTARDTGWGTIANLRTTLAKLSTVSFTDHYGDTYTVIVNVRGPEISKTPMWDASTNYFLVQIRIIQVS